MKKSVLILLYLLLAATNLFAQATLYTPNGKIFQTGDGGWPPYNAADCAAWVNNNFGQGKPYPNSYAIGNWEDGIWEYNCHTFAWNNWQGADRWNSQSDMWKLGKPSPYNLYWLNPPNVFFTDTDNPIGIVSYIQTANQNEASICTYSGNHSARIVGDGTRCISKWGYSGIVNHPPTETPYSSVNAYYKINPAYRPVGVGDPVGRNWQTIGNALIGIPSGGAISVLSGTQSLSGNITIPSSVTLRTSSGTTLTFSGNYKLRIEGKLVANGTTFTRSGGQWYGIEFYMNYGSGSSIQYSTIENAQYGVYAYGADPYLSHNTIRNNSTGVYADASVSSMNWNLFENNTYGVQCANYGDANIQNNNLLRYNGWAVYGDAYSNPCLGSYIGYNSLYWNDYFDVFSYYGGTIYAYGNWWGGYPAYPSIYGNVDYSGELSVDPNNWAGAMNRVVGTTIKQDAGTSGGGMGILDGDTTGIGELNAAYRSLHNNDSLGAFSAFRNLLERHPDRFVGSWAVVTAFNLAGRLRMNDRQLLDDVISRHPGTRLSGTAKLLLVGLLLKGEESGQALGLSTSLINNSDSTIAKHALFNAGNIAWYRLKNERLGENYFRQLIARFPGDPLSESALATLGGDTSPGAGPKKNAADLEAKAFTLRECYPNPFNPSTQINYELPEAARVSLIVYDILGRRVAELVNGYQEPGSRTAIWNAHDVASGVYFARFTATDGNGTLKLSKLMKLVLAK